MAGQMNQAFVFLSASWDLAIRMFLIVNELWPE